MNKVYAASKLYKTSMSVNRESHFWVRFVRQVWELSPAFNLYSKILEFWRVEMRPVQQSSMLGF